MARALVVEDNENVRRVLRRALEEKGWETSGLDDGAELAGAIGRERYDLIVVDLRMPGMNGFEALRLIRQTDRVPRCRRTPPAVPVVVVSGRADDATFAFCRRLGADACLAKPVDVRDLQRTAAALRQRPRRGRAAPERRGRGAGQERRR